MQVPRTPRCLQAPRILEVSSDHTCWPLATPGKGWSPGDGSCMLRPAPPWRTIWKTLSDGLHALPVKKKEVPLKYFRRFSTQGLTRLCFCLSLKIKQYLKVFRSGRPSGGGAHSCSPFNCAASNLFIPGLGCTFASSLFAFCAQCVSSVL